MRDDEIDEARENRVLTDWCALTNDVQGLCVDLWDRTSSWTGLNTDPAAFSMMLFKRAYGHIRAFSLLYNAKFFRDADGCARSAVEVAICLANLAARREAFVEEMRSDAAVTTKGQIPIWSGGDAAFGREASAEMARVFGERRKDGGKHEKLDMKAVADGAGLPQLYRWYRHFSGTRVHVTGLSILADAVAVGDEEHEQRIDTYARLRRIDALATAGGATVISCEAHSKVHGIDDLHDRAAELMRRMSTLGPTDIFADKS
ncbi:MAG: hypothetical protein E7812_12480 [Phenylobacterium sp.]|nr:MAG: hypothetical protein E7812_12480 [Phenylobacterium sp.]